MPDGALRDLLHYTQNGSVGSDPLVRRIDRIVTEANDDRKWVSKVFYCVSTIEENDARRARILERLALKRVSKKGGRGDWKKVGPRALRKAERKAEKRAVPRVERKVERRVERKAMPRASPQPKLATEPSSIVC